MLNTLRILSTNKRERAFYRNEPTILSSIHTSDERKTTSCLQFHSSEFFLTQLIIYIRSEQKETSVSFGSDKKNQENLNVNLLKRKIFILTFYFALYNILGYFIYYSQDSLHLVRKAFQSEFLFIWKISIFNSFSIVWEPKVTELKVNIFSRNYVANSW